MPLLYCWVHLHTKLIASLTECVSSPTFVTYWSTCEISQGSPDSRVSEAQAVVISYQNQSTWSCLQPGFPLQLNMCAA